MQRVSVERSKFDKRALAERLVATGSLSRLSGVEARIWGLFWNAADDDGCAQISLAELAEKVGSEVVYVTGRVKRLQEMGFLELVQKGGRRFGASRRRVCVPKG